MGRIKQSEYFLLKYGSRKERIDRIEGAREGRGEEERAWQMKRKILDRIERTGKRPLVFVRALY